MDEYHTDSQNDLLAGYLKQILRVNVRLISFHQHNQQQRIPELLQALADGEAIALISDAGLPGISDPGEELVAAARAASMSCAGR